MKFLLQLLYFIVVLSPVATHAASSLTPLTIETDNNKVSFDVELAETPEQAQQGLMFRDTLPMGHGMLFLFSPPRTISFWMKNTSIPLDIIFIGPDSRVSHIARNTTPQSEAAIPSGGIVRAALEVNAGDAERLRIEPGNLVTHEKLK